MAVDAHGSRWASWENRQVAGATVHSMYKDVRSRLRAGDGYRKDIGVRVGLIVGVHQGSVLSQLFLSLF